MKNIIIMVGLSLSLVACGVVSATGSVVGGTIKAVGSVTGAVIKTTGKIIMLHEVPACSGAFFFREL